MGCGRRSSETGAMTDGSADPASGAATDEFVRCPQVLWRQGPDRVLVRRVSGEALDLLGAAALVWVALDGRRTAAQLLDELGEFGLDAVTLDSTLADLMERGVLETAS